MLKGSSGYPRQWRYELLQAGFTYLRYSVDIQFQHDRLKIPFSVGSPTYLFSHNYSYTKLTSNYPNVPSDLLETALTEADSIVSLHCTSQQQFAVRADQPCPLVNWYRSVAWHLFSFPPALRFTITVRPQSKRTLTKSTVNLCIRVRITIEKLHF